MSNNDNMQIGVNNETRKNILSSRLVETNPIVVQLQNFGYNKIYSRRVFYYLHPEDLEEALNYMAIENGIIQHRFIQDRNNSNNLCYICGEQQKIHLNELNNRERGNRNYIINILESIKRDKKDNNEKNEEIKLSKEGNNIIINQNTNNILTMNQNKTNNIINHEDNQNTKDELNLIQKEEKIECDICNEMFIVDKNNKVEECGHAFCSSCWFDFLSVNIKENKLPSIKCLDYNCRVKLTDEFIINLLGSDQNLIQKYKRYKLELEIINDPNKKLCPYPNCDSYLELIDIRNKDVTCKNGHKYCFDCLKKPHGKLPCNAKIDKSLIEFAKNNFVKKCPKCSIITEKNQGCNHITCTKCRYQWCWLCNEEYKVNHFKEGKCRGFQFFQPKNDYEIKLVMEGKINFNELSSSQRQNNLIINDLNIDIPQERNHNHFLGQDNYNSYSCLTKFLIVLLYLFFGHSCFMLGEFSEQWNDSVFFFHLFMDFVIYFVYLFQLLYLGIILFLFIVIFAGFKKFILLVKLVDYDNYKKYFISIIMFMFFAEYFYFLDEWIILFRRNNIFKLILLFPYIIISIIIFFPQLIVINTIIIIILCIYERDASSFINKIMTIVKYDDDHFN